MEIERKWMVKGWPEDVATEGMLHEQTTGGGSVNPISLPLLYTEYQEQGYLHTDAPIVRIRMEARSGCDAKYVLCFKSAGLLAREEIEMETSKEDFSRLAALTGHPLIRKTRRVYELPDSLHLEVNLVDEGLPTEFMYAEVEFSSEEQARSWRPDACGLGAYLSEEVTELPGQSMSAFWARTRKV